MMDYRKAYGLPERYFLSLGRMVEKKNLATLIAAYGRYCDESRGFARQPLGNRVTSDEFAGQAPASLVFVGSGELEGALREQARGLGLRVVDRTEWGSEEQKKAGHGLGKIDADKSELLSADRTEGNADGPVTRAVGEGPQTRTEDCKLNTEHSVENDRGAVFFYGFRQIEENAVFYALAEAFVLPSLKEEWGLVVNEAMAAGLPVIVSRTAGCAEDLLPEATASRRSQLAVDSGQFGGSETTENCKPQTENSLELRSNGFVFDPTSSDALSEALRRIADQETKRQPSPRDGLPSNQLTIDKETSGVSEMGKRSREIVAQFSCENFAKQALRAAEAASA
jgi:glycosyltransferase involved in cell wall biosynthesis